MLRWSSVRTFCKAQVSAFLGGATDYLVMVCCTELLHIHYTVSIAIGGIVGAVVNFTINRHWSFGAASRPIGFQFAKFAAMVAGSIVLKAAFTYAVTEYLHLDYRISRLAIELFVSLGFNYPLQHYWVFKR